MGSRAWVRAFIIIAIGSTGTACGSSKNSGGGAAGGAGHKASSASMSKDASVAKDAATAKDSGAAPSSAVKPGDKASADITAAKGGTLALGGVKANIPVGALSADTTVTVEVLDKSAQPSASDIVADVYDFGPDGTTFKQPVTLELDVGALQVPSGKQAMLAYLDNGKWVNLMDSKLSGSKVTATTMHFTPFTVVLTFTPDSGVMQTGGACSTDAFDACGGDLTGTWTYTAACATFPPTTLGGSSDGGTNPFAMCKDQPQIALSVDLTGTATFNGDGTYSTDQTISSMSETRIPASCVSQVTMGMGDPAMACTSIIKGMVDSSGDCVSAGKPDMTMQSASGTWSTQGGMLITKDSSPDAGSKNEETTYCVTGNDVTVVVKSLDKGYTLRYMATRK